MPFSSVQDLPASVRQHIPAHAEAIFLKAFNSAWDQYDQPAERQGDDDREETAFKVAWAAVKKKYRKDPTTGRWLAK